MTTGNCCPVLSISIVINWIFVQLHTKSKSKCGRAIPLRLRVLHFRTSEENASLCPSHTRQCPHPPGIPVGDLHMLPEGDPQFLPQALGEDGITAGRARTLLPSCFLAVRLKCVVILRGRPCVDQAPTLLPGSFSS